MNALVQGYVRVMLFICIWTLFFHLIRRHIFSFAKLNLNTVDKVPSGLDLKQFSLLLLVNHKFKEGASS